MNLDRSKSWDTRHETHLPLPDTRASCHLPASRDRRRCSSHSTPRHRWRLAPATLSSEVRLMWGLCTLWWLPIMSRLRKLLLEGPSLKSTRHLKGNVSQWDFLSEMSWQTCTARTHWLWSCWLWGETSACPWTGRWLSLQSDSDWTKSGRRRGLSVHWHPHCNTS